MYFQTDSEKKTTELQNIVRGMVKRKNKKLAPLLEPMPHSVQTISNCD
jgi:hypothetical protein